MTVSENPADRRRFKRAIFTIEDNVVGILSIPGVHEKAFSTNILNISEGGLQFTLDKENKNKIRAGDRVVVLQIKAPTTLKFLMNIDAEIKWVLSNELLDDAGAGCQFINVSPTSREQISGFVDSWIESRGL